MTRFLSWLKQPLHPGWVVVAFIAILLAGMVDSL